MRAMWVLVAMAAGCARQGMVVPSQGVLQRPSAADVVPAGTLLSAQLRQPLSTRTSHVGDRFTAELLDPVVDGRGALVVPVGALVEGVVGGTDPSKIGGDGAWIELSLSGVRTHGEGLLFLPLEVASAPVEVDPGWGQIVGLALAGAALGAGVGVAIDSDQAAVPIALSLVGTGLGALLGGAVGRRDASVEAGSVLTLRLREDSRIDTGLARTGEAKAP